MRLRAGITFLEVVIIAFLLTVTSIPLFHLVGLQRQEIGWARGELAMHDHAIRRMAEMETKLMVSRYASPRQEITTSSDLDLGGSEMRVEETLSIQPSKHTSGLHRVHMVLKWRDSVRGGATRSIALTRHIVDRGYGARTALRAASPVPTVAPAPPGGGAP